MPNDESIHLDDAHVHHGCITPRLGAALAEAAAWALTHHGHPNGIGLVVQYQDETRSLAVKWTQDPDPKSESSYTDHQRVAEDAATILALESVRVLTGLTGSERSQKGTRFDYYLTSPVDDTLIFNYETRALEVSGIFRQAGANTVPRRRNEKQAV